jgi:hypothetical protein
MLPSIPSIMLLLGSTKSGKSTTALNLFGRKRFYYDLFDKIVIISPSAAQDDSFQGFLELEKVEHHAHMSDELIRQLVARQDADVAAAKEEGAEPPQMLLYLDDVLNEKGMSAASELSGLLSRHRHHKISVWCSIQQYRGVPGALRNNTSAILLFRLSDQERKKVQDEFGSAMGPQFLEMLDWCCRKKYSFAVMRLFDSPALFERFAGEMLYDAGDKYLSEFTKATRFDQARASLLAENPQSGLCPLARGAQSAGGQKK